MNFTLQKTKRKTTRHAPPGPARVTDVASTDSPARTSAQHSVGTFYSAGPVVNLSPVQAKYTIGAVNDPFESEADAVAENVVSGKSVPSISRLETARGGEKNRTGQQHEGASQPPGMSQRRADNDGPQQADLVWDGHDPKPDRDQTTSDFTDQINRRRGRGARLPSQVGDNLGRKLGWNLGGVGIHSDETAANLNRKINARAFTVGNDIFFGEGEYVPASSTGQRLLAHELTHVVQQSSSPVSHQVQRNGGTAPTNTYEDRRLGSINTTSNEIVIKGLKVPTFKNTFYQNATDLKWRRSESAGGEARDTNQITVWENDVRESSDTKVDRLLTRAQRTEQNGQYIYYFSYNTGRSYLFGPPETIKQRARRPVWRQSGTPASFHVDHQVEYQTNGPDEIGNMWLLDGSINTRSGGDIRTEIRTKVGAFVLEVQDKVLNPPTDTDNARANYEIKFEDTRGGLGSYPPVRAKQQYYTRQHIKNGDQLRALDPMSQSEINGSGLLSGDADHIDLFPNGFGGFRYQLVKESGSNVYRHNIGTTGGSSAVARQNFEITSVQYDASSRTGSVLITVPSRAVASSLPNSPQPVAVDPVPILPLAGVEWGGQFDKNAMKRSIREKVDNFPGLSSLQLNEVDMDAGGITMSGVIRPSIPLIEDTSVDFELSGETIMVSKTFSGPDFNIPSPFEIQGSSLTIAASNQGLSVTGQINFGIERVGEGQISATGRADFNAETSFELEGQFDFDERIFGEGTTAQVRVGYSDSQWSMGGTLTIPEGKVPGVESATITVDYSESAGFSAEGEAELDVPGVESGTLSITHTEAEGFSIGGSFNLSGDTPGIRGGTLTATLREKPNGSGFSISASGEAQPDIPGINSNLSVTYDDGAFTAEIEADYTRGMLSGQINVGVTNRSVGEDGELSATAEPDNPLIVYGGGSLTIRITPWLEGTAGVRFAPDGEITVTGRIGIPDELEIFARREIDKSIFNIAVQAPIFPGIVAEVGGGLGAVAGIGPGVIDRLELTITYNPAREQDTTITGDAHLRVPADAGLRLSVRAGIGLGITGASATGGLEIGGTLGIEGAAEAGVHVDWSPARGLDLNANVSVHAQPAFTFDISGYVSVRALGFSVYDQTWELASFRFGSDYRFGIRLPVHYQEGQPFDISLDDVEFEVPDIDPGQLMRGLIGRIA